MYKEENGQVVLTLTREDYAFVLFALGAATGVASREGLNIEQFLKVVDRINEGNPDYVPYTKERT